MGEDRPARTAPDGETFPWKAKGCGDDAAQTYAPRPGVLDVVGAVDR